MDIDASTINGGETTNEEGPHECNMHVSFECDPDFPLNHRSPIPQGARLGVYRVITWVSNFIMDEVLANVVCHLASIAHGAVGKLCSMPPPFGIRSPALINHIHFQANYLGFLGRSKVWSEKGGNHNGQNKAPKDGIGTPRSHGVGNLFLKNSS